MLEVSGHPSAGCLVHPHCLPAFLTAAFQHVHVDCFFGRDQPPCSTDIGFTSRHPWLTRQRWQAVPRRRRNRLANVAISRAQGKLIIVGEARRAVLWAIFERVRAGLKTRGLMTESAVFQALADAQADRPPVFDAAVVDEAQDVSIAQLRFLAALGGSRLNALFFAGDLGQRIFQQPFSWKALGVEIRGRSKTLRVNYRTSHQIREQADRLLGPEIADADGNREDRRHAISVFNGPLPEIRAFPSDRDESEAVGNWLRSLRNDGIQAHEIGVFVRSPGQVPRATAAVAAAGLSPRVLDDRVEIKAGSVSIGTMHLAKGLEFRAVAVMACDDEVLPLQTRIETVGDDGDLQEVYDTERQLLYVACTRARDRLSISGVEPASEFLEDLGSQRQTPSSDAQ